MVQASLKCNHLGKWLVSYLLFLSMLICTPTKSNLVEWTNVTEHYPDRNAPSLQLFSQIKALGYLINGYSILRTK